MLLLQHGAQVDAPTKEMYTALHVASKAGQEEVVKFLTKKITDLFIINYVLERLKLKKDCNEVLSNKHIMSEKEDLILDKVPSFGLGGSEEEDEITVK